MAIGLAWSGLLANFAAGSFLIILRPIKVGGFRHRRRGDRARSRRGSFASAINTPDNVLTLVGNNRIFTDTIQNFSVNPIAGSTSRPSWPAPPTTRRQSRCSRCGWRRSPTSWPIRPSRVEILEFNLVGPVLVIRPYCHNDHYWQVYFDGNKAIRESWRLPGFPPGAAQVVFVNR